MGVCYSGAAPRGKGLCCLQTDQVAEHVADEASPISGGESPTDLAPGVPRFASSWLIQSEEPPNSETRISSKKAVETAMEFERQGSENSVHSATPKKSVAQTKSMQSTACLKLSSRASSIVVELLSAASSQEEGSVSGTQTVLTEDGVDRIVAELEYLVDWQYDTMLAELVLLNFEEHLPMSERLKVYRRAVMTRLNRKFLYLERVGEACLNKDQAWFNIYKDGSKSSIEACLDKHDSTVLNYRARVTIPAPLATVMVVTNEVDMMPEWNKLVTGTPEVLGRRTAHYMCLNYRLSIMGMYKIDILNEIRRFSDIRGGLFVEYICSIEDGHPCYREPGKGFNRPKTELKNVWLACGPDTTVLVQMGKLKLPFSASKWLATSVGGVAGRFIVGGLLNNSLRAEKPGNPWEKRMEEDSLGLYQRLREVAESEGSLERAPTTPGGAPCFNDDDLVPLFVKRRNLRASFSPEAINKESAEEESRRLSALAMRDFEETHKGSSSSTEASPTVDDA